MTEHPKTTALAGVHQGLICIFPLRQGVFFKQLDVKSAREKCPLPRTKLCAVTTCVWIAAAVEGSGVRTRLTWRARQLLGTATTNNVEFRCAQFGFQLVAHDLKRYTLTTNPEFEGFQTVHRQLAFECPLRLSFVSLTC